jgi:hypothetical protein
MQGKITRVDKKKSCTTRDFYWVFFTMADGKSARTCLVESFSNFGRWKPAVDRYFAGEEVILEGLLFKDQKGRLINADSVFTTKY